MTEGTYREIEVYRAIEEKRRVTKNENNQNCCQACTNLAVGAVDCEGRSGDTQR